MKAVITGDIIHSTKMNTDDRKELIEAVSAALKQWDKDFNMKSEVYRGDSFQCLLNTPMYAWRVALIIKTYIKGMNPSEQYNITKAIGKKKKIPMTYPVWMFDARIGVGIGEIDAEEKTLRTSNGDAFLLSGHLLDYLKTTKQTIGIRTSDSYAEELRTESILLDHLISRATALQCEVIKWKLLGYTETWIANELNINQSAVNQRSNSAGWNAISSMLERFENIYSHE